MFIIPVSKPFDTVKPCVPNPCGPNAICQDRDGAGSCTCTSGYFGNPYEGCRPECVINSDCSDNRACINNKCQDPCPGFCGTNAQCQTVNHIAKCTCVFGYIGNPYDNCVYRKGKQAGCKFIHSISLLFFCQNNNFALFI